MSKNRCGYYANPTNCGCCEVQLIVVVIVFIVALAFAFDFF